MKKSNLSKRLMCLVVTGTMLTPTLAYAKEAVNKDESVYVILKEDGKVKDTIVGDWLHTDEGTGINVEDKTLLKDIKNVKGNEKPEQNGDTIKWQSKSNDIFYQGKTDKEVPLKLDVKYYLDGKKVNPKDIAGKSGRLKIKINYNNNDKKTVNINGKSREIYTPLTAITMVTLPIDKFSNVKINEGKVLSEGNNQLVNFISFPGLKESFNVDNDDINSALPSSLEIKADVENFEMLPIVVTATPELPDVKSIKDSTSLDDLEKGFKDLKEATDKILDGSSKLKDGTGKLADGMNKLDDGTVKLLNGSYVLKQGINTAAKSVYGIQGEMAKQEDKIGLISNPKQVAKERKLLEDAYIAMGMDTSTIEAVSKLITKEEAALFGKINSDYNKLNKEDKKRIEGMLNIAKSLNPEDLKSVETLLNSAEKFQEIDLSKINPLLEKANEIRAVLTKSVKLTQVDTKTLSESLEKQVQGAEKYNKETSPLREEASKNALLAVIENSTLDANPEVNSVKKAKLKELINGYYNAVVIANNGMQQSKALIQNAQPTLKEMVELQTQLNQNKDLIAGLNNALSEENINKAKVMLGQFTAMQQALKTNSAKIESIKFALTQMNDPETQKTLGKIKILQDDIKNATPILGKIEKVMTPDMMKELEKSPQMVNQLKQMQGDLKDSQDILRIVDDSLKEGNIKRANQLLSALPSLTNGVNQLSEGSNQLYNGIVKLKNTGVDPLKKGSKDLEKGAKELNEGIDKYKKEGINKVDEKVSPKITDVKDLVEVKDQLVSISENYGAFTGTSEDMKGSVKFIMKTDEIKVPKHEEKEKKEVKEEKKGFFHWLKNIFTK